MAASSAIARQRFIADLRADGMQASCLEIAARHEFSPGNPGRQTVTGHH
jgi:DNA-binding CsgD family transcriptional regulator